MKKNMYTKILIVALFGKIEKELETAYMLNNSGCDT